MKMYLKKKRFIWQRCTRYINALEKAWRHTSKLRRAMSELWFFERQCVIKMESRYRTQYGNNSISRCCYPASVTAVSRNWNGLHCREREDRALHRKKLIEFRKCFLEANKTQLCRCSDKSLAFPVLLTSILIMFYYINVYCFVYVWPEFYNYSLII
jgi:hypothetical protein